MDSKELKNKVLQIQEDKSKASLLLDLLSLLDPEKGLKTAALVKVIHGLSRAIIHIIKRGGYSFFDIFLYLFLKIEFDFKMQT